ncbi:MAG: leucyl aminopeptidase [Methylotenera sp.]|nr:leucyl aminopeptidase [Methylotenera sp.]
MEFSIKSSDLGKDSYDCLVVGVFTASETSSQLSNAAQALDVLSGGYIARMIQQGDMTGKLESTVMLHHIPNLPSQRVLLVGLGKQEDFTEKSYIKAIKAAVKALNQGAISQALICLAEISVQSQPLHWKIARLVETIADVTYKFDAIKKKDADAEKNCKKSIEALHINISQVSDIKLAEVAMAEGMALAKGVSLAKDLGNLPPNVCTPTYLANQAQALANQYGFKVEVLEREAIAQLGMGSFLGVTQGSDEPPKLIVMQHLKGQNDQKPVVLVGKGITFDTGGISLKPGAEMDEMKYDMCGAASVIGTFKTIAELNLPLNVIGIIPTCENMPSGRATRPGDVLTSMSGLTIEVLNTDAEGRLILCDALTYAERFEPSAVIDIATLTGACVIALGAHASGLFSNNDALAKQLLNAGETALDRAWHMPMWDDYQPQLDSNFADMANIGGRAAGSITAACFLSRFTKKYDWAHLDIAGTAWKSGKEKGGTGRPVPLLTAFLQARIQAK